MLTWGMLESSLWIDSSWLGVYRQQLLISRSQLDIAKTIGSEKGGKIKLTEGAMILLYSPAVKWPAVADEPSHWTLLLLAPAAAVPTPAIQKSHT